MSEGQWLIRHVPKEYNQVADCLVKLSLKWRTDLQVYDKVPNDALEVLNQGKARDTSDQFSLM